MTTEQTRPATLKEAIAQAVDRGAEAVAQFYGPDWYRPGRIALTRLDLSRGTTCIVGQLEGRRVLGHAYDEGLDALYQAGVLSSTFRAIEAAHGFNNGHLPYNGEDTTGYVDYPDLDRAWKRKIRALRAADRTTREV
jgi:hypothetical protein